MLFLRQLISFRLIFLTKNPLVSGWSNEQDICLLNVCVNKQIYIQEVDHVFLYVLLAGDIQLFL